MTRQGLHALLQTLFRWSVLLTLCVAPTQWSLEPRPKLHLSLADLVLAASAGLWLLDLLVSGDVRRRLRLLPWSHVLFVACAGASVAIAADKGAAVKDLIQIVEYFVVGALVFGAFLSGGERRMREALIVLAAATAANLALAAAQYLGGAESPLAVRGAFGNRNVLGGFLAMALPLCFAGTLGSRHWLLKVAFAAMLVLGLSLVLSGAAFGAALGAVACLAAARGAKVFLPTVALLVVLQALVLPRLPRENDLAQFQSVALYDGSGQVERRYPDWQAAYSMVLTHPVLGVGLGNYQKHVGQYYDNVPRQTGPSEPDIQNLYLVLAASCGLPALFAFLAMLVTAAKDAGRAAVAGRGMLASGAVAALAAFAFTAVWHPLLVRGIGLPLVFLLALAHHLGQTEAVHGRGM